MPECSCGQPATVQVDVGSVRRGNTWHRMFTPMCPECAAQSWAGREEARAS